MPSTDQLVEALRMIPSQLAADLTLGLPLIAFVALVMLAASSRRRRHHRRWV